MRDEHENRGHEMERHGYFMPMGLGQIHAWVDFAQRVIERERRKTG
jgi:hypothetical protein